MSAPLIDFSSANVLYSEGRIDTGAPDIILERQAVRVILAELTNQTYGLVIFQVFECGLTRNTPMPLVEMLIPDPLVSFACKEQSRTITVTYTGTPEVERRLHFSDTLEFWNVMEIVSRLRSEEEVRIADLKARLRQVRTTVPSHSADPVRDAWCQNHMHTSENIGQSTVSGSPTTTIAGSPTISGSPVIIGSTDNAH